jgi:hypothetical protein
VVLLILIGIHNAWDVVTYLALGPVASQAAGADQEATRRQ